MLIVLYEDQLAPQQKRFGPHELLIACLADDGVVSVRERLDPRPCKGAEKVVAFLTSPRLADRLAGDTLLAVFDGDRLPFTALGLARSASVAEFTATLKDRCPAAGLRVFVLERNLEDLLRAAQGCERRPDSDPQYQRAISQKKLLDRDIILNRIAQSPVREVRDCVRERMPSFEGLVKSLAEILS